MSIADAMASNGMKEAGYEYINLDGERRGGGNDQRDTYCTLSIVTLQIAGQTIGMLMGQWCQMNHAFPSKIVVKSIRSLVVIPLHVSDLQWSRTCHQVLELKGIQIWTGKLDVWVLGHTLASTS